MIDRIYNRIYVRRSWMLAGFLLLWLAAALGMLFYTALDRDGRFRRLSSRIAMRSGNLPPLRGSIYDRNGERLAWSRIYFDLYWERGTPVPDDVWDRIKSVLPGAAVSGRRDELGLPLQKGIPVAALSALGPLLRSRCGVFIHWRTERLMMAVPEIREFLGSLADGHGVSGLEKEFDYMLYGRDGEIRKVMLDRGGNFILNDDIEIVLPENGQDLIYHLSCEEMIGRSRTDDGQK